VHAYSTDGVAWTMGHPSVAYTTNVTWGDGTASQLARRERPVLVFGQGPGGCDRVPVALINGALNQTHARVAPAAERPASLHIRRPDSFSNTPTFTLIQPVLSGAA